MTAPDRAAELEGLLREILAMADKFAGWMRLGFAGGLNAEEKATIRDMHLRVRACLATPSPADGYCAQCFFSRGEKVALRGGEKCQHPFCPFNQSRPATTSTKEEP